MRNKFDGIIDLLRNDGSIIINKNLAFEIGNQTSIVYIELLSKYKYFKEKNMLTKDGYFFNTIDNFRLDTNLKGKHQRKEIKKLTKLNLIKMELRGIPPKRFFKIKENTDLILSLINKGSMKREKLKKKLAKKAEESKMCYFGTFKNSKTEDLNIPNSPINNTKVNNTKNNNKEPYIEPKNSSVAMSIFLQLFQKFTDKKHKPVKESKYYEIEELMEEISYELEEETINQQLSKFFKEFNYKKSRLPTLYYFYKVAGRYFFDHCESVFLDLYL